MFVHRHHVRVVEPRGQLRFAHGSAAGGFTLGRVQLHRPDDLLDGHVPVEQLVAREPDRAHSAAADDGAEPVPPGQKSPWILRSHERPLPIPSRS